MKRYTSILALLMAVSLVMLAGCGGGSGASSAPESEDPNAVPEPKLVQFDAIPEGTELVIMETSMGDITIRLFPEEAPKAVENFLTHAKNGFYNGLKFDKVMAHFMIRSGDPTNTGMDMGKSIWADQPRFPAELPYNLWHFTGALAYYNDSVNDGPMENGSQFFIVSGQELTPEFFKEAQDIFPENVIQKYLEVGGQPGLDTHYTVFGQVVDGMDVLLEISQSETQTLAPEGDITVPRDGVPVEEILITGFKFKTVEATSGEAASSSKAA